MATENVTPSNVAAPASSTPAPAASQTPGQSQGIGAPHHSVSDIPSLLSKYVTDQKQAAALSKAYYDEQHPEHSRAVDTVARMFEDQVGGEPEPNTAGDAFAGFKAGEGFNIEDTAAVVGVAKASGLAPEDLSGMIGAFREAGKVFTKGGDEQSFYSELGRVWGSDTQRRVEQVNDFLKGNPTLNRWVKTSGFGNDPRLAVALYAHVSKASAERGRLSELRAEWSAAKAAANYAKMNRLEEEINQGYAKLYGGSR
jgi:hypothetical protein